MMRVDRHSRSGYQCAYDHSLIGPLQSEFGWATADISSRLAVRLVLFGLLGPFAAAFMNRLGIRRVAAYGAGFSRTFYQTYLPACFVAGVLCLFAALAIVLVRERSGPAPMPRQA